MPRASDKECGRVGCHRIVPSGVRHCDEHRKQKNRTDHQIYKSKETQAFYKGSTWRHTRADVLHYEPLCRECGKLGIETAATEVDHITPIAAGGDKWDRENMQPLCKPCHSRKTASEVFGKN